MKTIYVIMGDNTYYDMGGKWPVTSTPDKVAAKRLCKKMNEWAMKYPDRSESPYDPFLSMHYHRGTPVDYDIEEISIFKDIPSWRKKVKLDVEYMKKRRASW